MPAYGGLCLPQKREGPPKGKGSIEDMSIFFFYFTDKFSRELGISGLFVDLTEIIATCLDMFGFEVM